MMAGYSGTPLLRKLGLTDGLVVYVFNHPEKYFDWLDPLPKNIVVKEKLSGDFDFIHLFVTEARLFQTEVVKG